jgi:hypothetical protein
VRTVAAWVLAVLAVVGVGVGVEDAVGVGRPAQAVGTATGFFQAGGGKQGSATEGVHGTVYLYVPPTFCKPYSDSLCQPYWGRPVALGHSDADGRFSIRVPAGTYFLVGTSPEVGGGLVIAGEVTVVPGRTAHGDLEVVMA